MKSSVQKGKRGVECTGGVLSTAAMAFMVVMTVMIAWIPNRGFTFENNVFFEPAELQCGTKVPGWQRPMVTTVKWEREINDGALSFKILSPHDLGLTCVDMNHGGDMGLEASVMECEQKSLPGLPKLYAFVSEDFKQVRIFPTPSPGDDTPADYHISCR